MKLNFLVVMVLLTSISPSQAKTEGPESPDMVKDCKIERTDGVVLYGQCLKKGSLYIFRSCVEFTCRVNVNLTRALEAGEESCLKTVSPQEFTKITLQEHQVNALSKVKYCEYGK